MSTLILFIGVLLLGQTGQAPADSRYSGVGGVSNPFAGGGATNTPPASSGNFLTNGGGAAASSVSPPPTGTPPGPPERVESTYNVGGNRTPSATPLGGMTGTSGTGFSATGAQPPPNLAPIGGSAYSQNGGSLTPLGREMVSSTPPVNAAGNNILKPTGMMRAMMSAHANSRLGGEWVTLDEIVSSASPRGDQSRQIEAYWDLCSSIADYFLGLREQEELRRLRGLFPNSGQALQRAEQELAVRVGTAERAARASQLRLASMSGRGSDRLPLPADQPFCGTYETRHEQVFVGRASAEATELNELISLRQAELQDACDAVNRMDALLREISARPGSQSDEAILRSLEMFALQRRAFVQIARDYNRRIARYVELARPGQLDSEQLIGMLIRRNPSATATRPGTSLPGDRRSQTGSEGRQTFAGADGWIPADDLVAPIAETASLSQPNSLRDGFVSPVSGEAPPIEFGERSILVQPPR